MGQSALVTAWRDGVLGGVVRLVAGAGGDLDDEGQAEADRPPPGQFGQAEDSQHAARHLGVEVVGGHGVGELFADQVPQPLQLRDGPAVSGCAPVWSVALPPGGDVGMGWPVTAGAAMRGRTGTWRRPLAG
jgi:hypothetical protein